MSGSYTLPIGEALESKDAITPAYLTRLLAGAGFVGTEVVACHAAPVSGTSHGGGGLFRFMLTLSPTPDKAGASSAPRSLVLKETHTIGSQVLDPQYARRELDCYAHNLFAGLTTRLFVPRAYHLSAAPSVGHYWMWMEDLHDAFAVAWTSSLVADALRAITELYAAWWERRTELASMGFLRYRAQAMYDGLWTDRIAQNCAAIEDHPQRRALSTVFTPRRCALLCRLSCCADAVYPLLDRLPQTLLHQDVWLPNLGRHGGKVALIDWSYAGPGTPGAELSQTVALLIQMWGGDEVNEAHFLDALYAGLTEDWGLSVSYADLIAGYDLAFCLRPAHALGGPVLGGILAGRATMVGPDDLTGRLAAAEAVFQRIERGVQRLDAC